MVSKEERAQKIRNIIQLLYNTGEEQYQKEIYNLLAEDTNGTLKLYKYRYFDEKGFHLDGLVTDTLWCSAPNKFNDPFDSKIGISLQVAQKLAFQNDLLKLNAIAETLSEIINEEITVDECDVAIKSIIKKLLKNKEIVSILHIVKNNRENKEDCNRFIVDNVSKKIEAMRIIIKNSDTSKVFKDAMMKLMRIISTLCDEDKVKLCTSTSPLKTFAEIQGIKTDVDETDLMFAIGEKCGYDKTEIEKIKIEIENVQQLIENITNNMFFIGCLTTDPKNRLMWSHYSKDHSGFCIEYDFSEWRKLLSNGCLLPIIYSQQMPQVSWENAIIKTQEAQQAFLEEFLFSLLIKDEIWQYESEWRILIPQSNGGKCNMPKPSCIYLGTAISEENKQEILKIAMDKHISVKQMKVDRCQYELHTVDILNFNS